MSFITSRPVCVYSCSQLRELWFNDLFMYFLAYVFASGGSLVGDPDSRALLGHVGSDFSSGSSHTNFAGTLIT